MTAGECFENKWIRFYENYKKKKLYLFLGLMLKIS
jgi:hypothetical protein